MTSETIKSFAKELIKVHKGIPSTNAMLDFLERLEYELSIEIDALDSAYILTTAIGLYANRRAYHFVKPDTKVVRDVLILATYDEAVKHIREHFDECTPVEIITVNKEVDLEEPKKTPYIKERLAPFLTATVPEEARQRLAEWRKMVDFRRSCLQNEYEVEGGVLKYNCASGFNNPSCGFNSPLKITKDYKGESETAIITYKDGRISILNGVSDRVVAGGEYKHCIVFTKLGLDQLIKLYSELETSHSNELTFDDRFELKHEIEATTVPIFKWIEERIGLTEKQLQMLYAHGR